MENKKKCKFGDGPLKQFCMMKKMKVRFFNFYGMRLMKTEGNSNIAMRRILHSANEILLIFF